MTATGGHRVHRRIPFVRAAVHLRPTDGALMVVYRRVAPPGRPATTAIAVPIRSYPCGHLFRVRAVCADVLLHIVLPREGLVADGAVDALLPRVFLSMTSGMPGGRERRRAAVAGSKWAGVLVLTNPRFGRHGLFGAADRGLWGRRLGDGATANALFG